MRVRQRLARWRHRWGRITHLVSAETPPPVPVVWSVVTPGAGGAFAGRTVAVTGAAGMLGRELVAALLEQGATVHAIDRHQEHLADLTVAHPGATDAQALVVHRGDLAVQAEVDRIAAAIAQRTDRLDALLHSVGGNDYRTISPAGGPDADSWRHVLDMNLVAPAIVTTALLPLLAEVPGAGVVVVTSVHGHSTSPHPHYAAAKAGATKLVRDLAACTGPMGIRVNAVAPGWLAPVGPDGAAGTGFDRFAPLGWTPVPFAAVVHAVLFLADPNRSPCTTGQELVVDAGALLESARSANRRPR